ncbi:MAG: peptidoglycan-binding protein [Pyrinomonadaceae bacterium]
MDTNSANRLDKVHPELKKRITQLIENLAGQSLDVRVVQGLRTFAEQDVLFNKRPKVTNARGGQSNHNYGLAVDLCPFKNGKPDFNDIKSFNIIGKEAKKLGLEWGGDWTKLVDKPHVQLRGMSIKQCFACFNKGGLKSVWSTMDGILGGAAMQGSEPKPDDLIEFKDSGAAVTALQEQLVKLNLMHEHEVDGEFGKITKNAVIAFQRMNKLTADGIVGDGTKAKLKAALGG